MSSSARPRPTATNRPTRSGRGLLLRSALVAFAAAVVAGVTILPGYAAQDPQVVEFTTAPPSAGEPSSPVGALEEARAHAQEHGLIDCVDPAQARLDDVILTFPNDAVAGAVITPVDFGGALESGELGRWNLLACKAAGQTL